MSDELVDVLFDVAAVYNDSRFQSLKYNILHSVIARPLRWFDPCETVDMLVSVSAQYQMIDFISKYLLGRANFGGVPIPIYDHLEFLDRPLVMTEKLPDLSKTSRRFEKEVHEWEQFDTVALLREITRAAKGKK